ncbi:MAG: hypothetical protein CO189_05400 [candidate division Zixibacteria bacterium CG_4_9_14_3_um_filter_46_8]|nr:MAG: hypothetical protein CO189_05400 [candidate division Zixibacteria bacterium CG_4_9_14_3_um_filter_46_8]
MAPPQAEAGEGIGGTRFIVTKDCQMRSSASIQRRNRNAGGQPTRLRPIIINHNVEFLIQSAKGGLIQNTDLQLHVIPDLIRNPERFLEASVRWFDNKAARPTCPP